MENRNVHVYKKTPVKLDVKNLLRDQERGLYRVRKIENSRVSSTKLGSFHDSNDHYDKICDNDAENIPFNRLHNENSRNKGVHDGHPAGSDLHARFSNRKTNSDDKVENEYLPLSASSGSTVIPEIYSYATNRGHRVVCDLDEQIEESRTSNATDNDGYLIPGEKEKIGQNRIGDVKNTSSQSFSRTCETNMSRYNVHDLRDSTHTYYEILQEQKKGFSDIGSHALKEQPTSDNGNAFGITNSSAYVDKARIPGNDKKCSKTRIVMLVVILTAVVAATVSVVTWSLTKSDGASGECVIENGCIPDCKEYPDILNGHVDTAEGLQQSSIRVICDPGFKVNGTDKALCQGNGTWNSVLTCVPMDCGKYQPPVHVHLVNQEYETAFDTILNLACDTGYKFAKQTDRSVRCNETGTWSGNPKCESLVVLTVYPSFILIGNVGKLTCSFSETPEWNKIDLKRINSDDSFVIASIENLIDSYSTETNGDNVKVTERSFTHNSGEVVVLIDTVQCNDAFGEAGDIEFSCNLFYGNSFTAFDTRDIRIQGQLTAPSITISQLVVEGQDTKMSNAFICDMHFPEPDGYIVIESDYDGIMGALLTTTNGEYETDEAWIEDIKTSKENCWFRTVVTFGLKSVSVSWHRKHIRCVANPAAQSLDMTVTKSKTGVVTVIPENLCYGQGDDILRHPYNCSLSVVCDVDNTIKAVSAAHELGCSITDIFFKDGITNTVGSSLKIVCIVEHFQGLADIKITRNNGELVSSMNAGDSIKGITTVRKESYVNTTNGMLSLYVDHLLCDDEATYRCIPEGSGTPSFDDISLDLNC